MIWNCIIILYKIKLNSYHLVTTYLGHNNKPQSPANEKAGKFNLRYNLILAGTRTNILNKKAQFSKLRIESYVIEFCQNALNISTSCCSGTGISLSCYTNRIVLNFKTKFCSMAWNDWRKNFPPSPEKKSI